MNLCCSGTSDAAETISDELALGYFTACITTPSRFSLNSSTIRDHTRLNSLVTGRSGAIKTDISDHNRSFERYRQM